MNKIFKLLGATEGRQTIWFNILFAIQSEKKIPYTPTTKKIFKLVRNILYKIEEKELKNIERNFYNEHKEIIDKKIFPEFFTITALLIQMILNVCLDEIKKEGISDKVFYEPRLYFNSYGIEYGKIYKLCSEYMFKEKLYTEEEMKNLDLNNLIK